MKSKGFRVFRELLLVKLSIWIVTYEVVNI